jgi:TDG/mug DNA glycosylase family protein
MTRPTRADLLAAGGRALPDLLLRGLRVLFVGINPGLYSAAVGHHFGRPGNRFWPALHKAGFTPRLFDPSEERLLLPLGYGITNIASRPSARADELSADELVAGAAVLRQKLQTFRPRFAAFLGVTAYRTAFGVPKAKLGPQEAIGDTAVWVLPSPSGLNAHHSLADLANLFAELRVVSETPQP